MSSLIHTSQNFHLTYPYVSIPTQLTQKPLPTTESQIIPPSQSFIFSQHTYSHPIYVPYTPPIFAQNNPVISYISYRANCQISYENKLHSQLSIYLLFGASQRFSKRFCASESQSRIYLPAHSYSILSDIPFWYLLVVFLAFIHVLKTQKALTFVPNSL